MRLRCVLFFLLFYISETSSVIGSTFTYDKVSAVTSARPPVDVLKVSHPEVILCNAAYQSNNLSLISPPLHPPNIYYDTPKVYIVNSAIAPLVPYNTGGTVPASIYGQTTTVAGIVKTTGFNNGAALTATFNEPIGITVDGAGNIFVVDNINNCIRKITPGGTVSTFAGNGNYGSANGIGVLASFTLPRGIAIDATGNMYIADKDNDLIRKVTPAGVVTTIAGKSGISGSADGVGLAATFTGPCGIAVDKLGNLYVADTFDYLIRKITPAGVVSTIAGTGTPGSADGQGRAASFKGPDGIAVDDAGNIYVADIGGGNDIRKIDPTGMVTTFAGSNTLGFKDGKGNAALFNYPFNITIDKAGVLFVSDAGNNAIRRIEPDGTVTTLAGGTFGYADGVGPAAYFRSPNGLTSDGLGNIYVADYTNQLIRKVVATGYTIDKPLPAGLVFDPQTGIISGTPTTVSSPTNYTVTAYNADGSSTTIVNIATELPTPLNFGAITIKNVCNTDFDPGATGGVAPIGYSSSNLQVATIVAGKVHIVGAGTSTITATDGASSTSQLLTVIAPVTPSLAISPASYTACQGQQITFTAQPANGGATPVYQWQVNGQPAGANSSTFSGTQLQTGDIITCLLTNNIDCTTVSTVKSNNAVVTINPNITPVVSVSNPGAVCKGVPLTFTATATPQFNGINYQWQVNSINVGTNSSSFTSSALNNGDMITCTVSSISACVVPVSSSSVTAIVTDIPTINFNGKYVIKNGGSVTLNPVTTGSIVTYDWAPATGLSRTDIASPIANPQATTTYTLTATSASNCSTVGTVTVNVVNTINIPNTFTPNGDGVNDVWDIPYLDTYAHCLVNVYSRSGQLVFHSVGYPHPWDGTFKGAVVPEGTYYYTIDLGNNSNVLSGYLSVIR